MNMMDFGRSISALQVKGANDSVNVRRLPKKKAPPRFGRKLTASQKENATHICAGKSCIFNFLHAHFAYVSWHIINGALHI